MQTGGRLSRSRQTVAPLSSISDKLDRAAFAIGSLSCSLLLASLLSACQALTTEEKLRHRSIVCVYTRQGEICEKEKDDASLPLPVTAP